MGLGHWLVRLERTYDGLRQRRAGDRTPTDFRIECYLGHGGAEGVVVRGRVVDDPEPSEAVEGERVHQAVHRVLRHFATGELPGVPLRVTVGDATAETETDADGYFRLDAPPRPRHAHLPLDHRDGRARRRLPRRDRSPQRTGRGAGPGPDARFGIVSDVDDTVLQTGVQRLGQMLRQTFTGSALTRTSFPGAPELYRDLAGAANPVFYVSSSPWNLHAFLIAFLRHQRLPLGPVLLRDLLGTSRGREQKGGRIEEILGPTPTCRSC